MGGHAFQINFSNDLATTPAQIARGQQGADDAHMSEPKTFGRREFTVASALAILSGVTITVSSCGGGSSPSAPSGPNPTPAPPPTPDPGGGDKVGSISANHGHTAVITAVALTAGAGVSLDIRGTSDHPHTVNLTDADMVAIAGNQRVSKTSAHRDLQLTSPPASSSVAGESEPARPLLSSRRRSVSPERRSRSRSRSCPRRSWARAALRATP